MADRKENVGTPNSGAQGKSVASTTTEKHNAPKEREPAESSSNGVIGGQPGARSGTKPGMDSSRERDGQARPVSEKIGDEEVATEEEQDEQGEGELLPSKSNAQDAVRGAKQSGLNTGEEDGDLDATRTTTQGQSSRKPGHDAVKPLADTNASSKH